jgi:hypothetical protein
VSCTACGDLEESCASPPYNYYTIGLLFSSHHGCWPCGAPSEDLTHPNLQCHDCTPALRLLKHPPPAIHLCFIFTFVLLSLSPESPPLPLHCLFLSPVSIPGSTAIVRSSVSGHCRDRLPADSTPPGHGFDIIDVTTAVGVRALAPWLLPFPTSPPPLWTVSGVPPLQRHYGGAYAGSGAS